MPPIGGSAGTGIGSPGDCIGKLNDPDDNVRHVDKVLKELTERAVLLSSTKEVLRGSRNSLVDVKYSLLPTVQFIREVKKANVRTAKLTEQLQRPVGKGLEE
jgi:hypothetical protein